jgi:hypothetical protein
MEFNPIKKKSTATDAVQKASEDESYDAIWKAKILQHTKREDTYSSNMGKAHSIIWKQCSRELQDKIEGRSDYNSHIKDNTISLLNAIEEHCLNPKRQDTT